MKSDTTKLKRVVYLGNMEAVAEALLGRRDINVAGWIVEKDDLRDEVFKVRFEKLNLPCYSVSTERGLCRVLKKIGPVDLGIIANFGIILGRECLKIPKKGFVNIHLGLLPEYPGRNPVRAAIGNSEKVTGLTMHRVTRQVDRGPVIARRVTAMPQRPEVLSVFRRLEGLAPALLNENLDELLT